MREEGKEDFQVSLRRRESGPIVTERVFDSMAKYFRLGKEKKWGSERPKVDSRKTVKNKDDGLPRAKSKQARVSRFVTKPKHFEIKYKVTYPQCFHTRSRVNRLSGNSMRT